MKKGKLYGVSVGPGDSQLITLKAVRIIKEADVIAIPAERAEQCEAYKIAAQAVPEMEAKDILAVSMPMTRNRNMLKEAHENGVKSVIRILKKGLDIAFLTIGDVGIYSSCQYICQPVKEMGYDVELIPGVTSFCAAAARLGKPLVSGNEKLHIIPSASDNEEWLSLDGVKVLMKPSKGAFRLNYVKNIIGIENCGKENERIFEEAPKEEEKIGYYSLFIIGDDKNNK